MKPTYIILFILFLISCSCTNNDITEPITRTELKIDNQSSSTLFVLDERNNTKSEITATSTITISEITHMGNSVGPIEEYLFSLKLYYDLDLTSLAYEQNPIDSTRWIYSHNISRNRHIYTIAITDNDLQ